MRRLFGIIFALIMMISLSIKGFAINSQYKNSLKKINIIEKSDSFVLDLTFQTPYTEPLSVVNKGTDMYSIILPETEFINKTAKISQTKDKNSIQLIANEHPYLDPSIKNGYVKITIKSTKPVKAETLSTTKKIEKANISPIEAQKNKDIQVKADKTPKPQPTKVKTTSDDPPEIKPVTSIIEPNLSTTKTKPLKVKGHKLEKIKHILTHDYFNLFLIICLITGFLLILLYQLSKKIRILTNEMQKIPDEQEENIEQFVIDDEELEPIEELVQDSENEDITENADLPEEQEKTNTQNSVSLLSNVKINDKSGFYLISHDNELALVGYISDEIFVIKTFKTIAKPHIQVRLVERRENKDVYIVRINGFKALVAVDENTMETIAQI